MTPSQTAIEYLKSNPSYAKSFDRLYGEGSSNKYLQTTKDNKEDKSNNERGLITDIPVQIAGGVVDAVKETGSLLGSLNDSIDNLVGTGGFARRPDGSFGYISNSERKEIEAEGGTVTSPLFGVAGEDDTITEKLYDVPDADTMVGAFVRPVAQFGAGFYTGGKILKGINVLQKATTGTKIARSMVAGGISDFAVFDEHEARLSDLVEQFPMLQNPVTNYLASDEDDSWAEGRFKNFIEGLVIGGAVESVFVGFRRYKRLRDAKNNNDKESFDKINKEETAKLNETVEETKTKKKTKKQLDEEIDVQKKEKIKRKVSKKNKGEDKSQTKKDSDDTRQYIDEGMEEDLKRFDIHLNQWREGKIPLSQVLDETFASGKFAEQTTDSATLILNKIYENLRVKLKDFDKKLTNDEIVELAQKTGKNPDEVAIELMRLSDEMTDAEIKLVSAMNVQKSMLEELQLISQKIKLGTADEIDFDTVYSLVEDLAMNIDKVVSKSSRMLNTRKIAIEGDDAINNINLLEFAKSKKAYAWNPTKKAKRKFIEDVSNMDKPSQTGAYLDKIMKATVGRIPINWDKLNEFFVNSILSSPKTHAINMTSNTIQAFITPMEQLIGGVMMRDRAVIEDAFNTYVGLVKYFHDSLKVAKKSLNEGKAILDESRTVDLENQKAIKGLKGDVIRTPSRLLGAEDEFFKQINYRAKLYAHAVRQVKAKLQNTKSRVTSKRMAELVEEEFAKGFDDMGKATNPEALDWAKTNTFTKDLNEKILDGSGRKIDRSSFGSAYQSMVNKFGVMRQITPFIRTPINITREVWARTPLLNRLMTEYRMKRNYGSPSEQAMARGKDVMGTTLFVTALSLAGAGKLTGGGPEDSVRRKQLLATGWKPYSFKHNDKYYSFERLDPFGMFFGLIADYHEVADSVDDKEKDALALGQMLVLQNQMDISPDEIKDIYGTDVEYFDISVKAVASISRNLTSKTYLKGLTDFLDILSSGDEDAVEKFVQGKIGAFVPFSSLASKIIEDPYYREMRGMMDGAKAKIPFYNQTLEPKYDATGRKQERTGSYLDNLLFPVTSSELSDDVVYNELARLDHAFKPLDTKIGDNKNINLLDFKNKDGKTAHLKMNELLETKKLLNGKTLNEALIEEINSNTYKNNLTDNINITDDMNFTGSRINAIQTIIRRYREMAKREVLKDLSFKNETDHTLNSIYLTNKKTKVLNKKQNSTPITAESYLNLDF